ncbi:hypothetical protein PVAP13_1NG020672 [Panicum virgatum]|uniref:Secreted protein n=1 Tax=Panicum virgatum TaxID=38727 RepID=A0A8T0WUW7_PANVG|nr:hypothetical protein PVAP13_1NG020672 [Panicum virgatum]
MVGISPVKLLLLALSATRLFITSHVVDGNCPVKKLLEMFSTCRGLRLRSRTMMLLEYTSSVGRPPDSMLLDKFKCRRPVRLPRDARETSVTVRFELQTTPSHLQQSVSCFHEVLRPPLTESSATNWSKELFSFSVHEVVGEANERINTRENPSTGVANLLVLLLHEE